MGVWISFHALSNFIGSILKPILPEKSPYHTRLQSVLALMLKYFKHIIHVICMLTTISLIMWGAFCQQEDCEKSRRLENPGLALTIFATAIQLMVLLPVPQIVCNVFGLLFINAFPGEIKVNKAVVLKAFANGNINGVRNHITVPSLESTDAPTIPPPISPASNLPHLCFRVVTRGLFPELVQSNVSKNFHKCIESGLINFSIEVVTDRAMQLLNTDQRVKQIVVPNEYRSSTGAMFKARALQYALEPGHSTLEDQDYIIHLDEETIVTQNVLNGITNFAAEGKYDFGQGLITYANIEIVNLFTTLADSYRVADDMGKVQFTLGILHRPIFGWKGSFVVTRCGAERHVSFDHGPDGSIAEDCYFSMIAYNKGYSFNFIQGEMFEKSPFTIMDLIRQRKRWVQGIWLVVHSRKIPITTKFFLTMSHYAWLTMPITSLSYIIGMIWYLPTPHWLQPIGSFCFAVTLYMYLFGLVKSFDLKTGPMNITMLFVYLIGQILTLTLNVIVENAAVVWGLFSSKHNFYIVKKDSGAKILPDP